MVQGEPVNMSFISKLSIFKEIWSFLRARKKWWLAPIILLLILLGCFIILAESSALGPFIYTIF